MKKHIWATLIAILSLSSIQVSGQNSEPDPNFFIYLCIGQSNMEAGARPEDEDKGPVDSRFQFMAAVDMPRYGRKMGNWYTAEPPINREGNNLGPVDFFGRTMVANLPSDHRIGVINVSVAGAKIELWEKETYASYLESAENWMKDICKQYNGNPYQRLVDMAKLAQKDGIIKGLLIHQGESNTGDSEWPRKVRGIYDNLIKDLNLNPEEFYLLAGELKYEAEHGTCFSFNSNVLPNLPRFVPNAHIISAEGCKGSTDPWHFVTAGFRELGKRYAIKMLELQGFPYTGPPASNDSRYASFSLELNIDSLGIDVSPTLNGIFYEDINQSNDGGISAQLIQNNSFQMFNVPGGSTKEFSYDPEIIYGWSTVKKGDAQGTAITVQDKPIVKYKNYYDFDPNDNYDDNLKYIQYCVKIDIQNPGEGFGLAANGYGINPYGNERQGFYYSVNTQKPSIPIKAGVEYNLGLYLQGEGYKGSVTLYLETANGEINSNTVIIKKLKNRWKKYTSLLKAISSEDSRLVIIGNKSGSFYLDFVTLIPEKSELWMEGKYGDFRKDMIQALADLNPKFMRFPGGCASEGPNYWGQVFWKNSIGQIEERIGFRNHWGTWTSQHIGFYEYLLLAESLGAKALPVLNNGVTCQFAGHSYIAPLETAQDRQRFYDIFVKDALDFIEFCNGDSKSEWGAKRIALGHKEPFNLEYLAIGNENKGEAFWERFDIIYKAVKEKYPEITIFSTSGAFASGDEFNSNYSIIDSKFQDTYVDEHYYMSDEWFYNNISRYDSNQTRGNEGITYSRERPTRVFVGEFANNSTNNAFVSTLAEAAFFTGLERNSDMVLMTAYAPLFCKKGFNKWNSNLIWFDNRGIWRSCNYYYMMLFANNTGNKTFHISPFFKNHVEDLKTYTSSTIDTITGDIFIKIVNSEAVAKTTKVNINSTKKERYNAELLFITSDDLTVKNQKDQNYYSSHPDVKNFSYSETITPQELNIGTIEESFSIVIPANSVNVLRLSPTR